jgi:hypothetical protein
VKRYYITNAGREVWDRISNGEPAYKVVLGTNKARKTVVQALTMSIMRGGRKVYSPWTYSNTGWTEI